MKFRVTLKDPDGPYDSMLDAKNEYLATLPNEMTHEEKEAAADARWEALQEAANEWLRCGEYVTIEIDTEAGTATVVKP